MNTNETCHFDIDTLRSTLDYAAMRYCPPYDAPRKAGRPKNNKRMKSPYEGKKKIRPWWMTMKEKKKGKVTQHHHASQKGLEVVVKIEWDFLVMLINNIYWYLVMQMDWPFFCDANE